MSARRTQNQPTPSRPLFDTAAEAEVLGCLLLDPTNTWPEASAAGLTLDDFTSGEHRLVFEAAKEQFERSQDADSIGVYERMRAKGIQDHDLLQRLHGLTQNAAPGLSALRRLARMLREQGLRRKLAAAVQSGTLADALELAGTIKDGAQHGHDIELLDVGHMLDNEPPELDFVLPGLLAGTVGMLVSPGSSGKSMLTAQLCMLAATGVDTLKIAGLLDKPIAPARVVYLTAEDPSDVIWARVKHIAAELTPQQRRLLRENLVIGDVRGRSADILDPAWRARIARLARGARLVVLDTLRRFHTADENDSGEAAQVLAAIESLARECVTTFLLPHHTNKSGARESGGDQQAARGSSVLTDNARLQINLARMTEKEAQVLGVEESLRGNFVRMVFAKVNYTAPMADLWLRRGHGGVLGPAHFGIAGAAATRQALPGARVEDSIRTGGVVAAGGGDDDDWN
jgi:RecA-family ATPase